MAAGILNWNVPRNLIFDAIIKEIRSWAEAPRRIFTQAHYGGKSVEEIAVQSGLCPKEVSSILETHEGKLRNALKVFHLK
jgi:DNA-directed RNA polymerase specialized sigma24 family protein